MVLLLGIQGSTAGGDAQAARGAPPRPLRDKPTQSGLSAATVQRLAQNANAKVIILLRDQHASLPARGAMRAARLSAIATDQAPLLSELSQVRAAHVRAYHVINAIAATVSAAEEAHLAANLAVQAVVPDRTITEPKSVTESPASAAQGASASAQQTTSAAALACGATPSLEPQALQLTNTAFTDTAVAQAQNIVTGTGVTVAFLADGLDSNNLDLIRPDGTHVVTDYQDFSGDGLAASTAGGEAFGDVSSIAAQGVVTYDLSTYVNPAHPLPSPCNINIRGMAPGASVIALKVFANNVTTTSNFVQAIEYAVDHGANVINELFGGNPYPDTSSDPISLADDEAVAAGVTVVVSSGDAGTAGTLGSPATDPNVISVGASTQFKEYAQVSYGAFGFGNGNWLDDNISSLSSAGVTQSGQGTVDIVAPGDLSWALCSTNTKKYVDCADPYNNSVSRNFQTFGGTSESAPLTAGEAALVIQAYRQTHGGITPSPTVVKQIIKSTATDLSIPTYEQGAGLINSLKAVQAALSYQDSNGTPALQGNGLVVGPDTLAATDLPGTAETFSVQITNTGALTQTVQPSVQTLDNPSWSATYSVPLTVTGNPNTFVDYFGRLSVYTEQDFTVPASAARLDAAIAWNVAAQPGTGARLTLYDPSGTYAAYSLPQGSGQGYGHVDVTHPAAGTWRAIIWAPTTSAPFVGNVQLSVATSNFVSAGSVSPSSQQLLPGQVGTFTVTTSTPAQPGDETAAVVISSTDSNSNPGGAGALPIVLRSDVVLGPTGGSFGGTLTGGNGRPGAGPTQTYAFDVPPGLNDLDLSLVITDSNSNLEGILVDPNGLPIDVQSTVTSLDPSTFTPTGYTNALQFFRRTPEAGEWKFVLLINGNTSGMQTSLPFTASITLNGVQVQATGLPGDAGTALSLGVPVTVPVVVTNTGAVTENYFADPRLASSTQYALLSGSGALPTYGYAYVPSESSNLTVVAETMSPTVPVSMDVANENGAPPYGQTGSPDVEAVSSIDSGTGNYEAVASIDAPAGGEVVPGYWAPSLTSAGPYDTKKGITGTTSIYGAVATAQQFDPAVDSSTGNFESWNQSLTANYAPLTLAPGESGVISVTITPTGDVGSVISGTLYIDTMNIDFNANALITGIGDELIGLPYTYTVASTAVPTETSSATATASPTGTPTPTDTVVVSPTDTVVASASPTSSSTVAATETPTSAATPTATPTAPAATRRRRRHHQVQWQALQ